jgi:hypothetical protein
MARISAPVRSDSKSEELTAPHALANGDSPGCNPLAGVEQVHYRVVPTRGEVSTARIESGGDAAANVSSEVFAQRKGGYVDDADGVFRHVGEDHAVTRMIKHRGRRSQLPKRQLL